MVIIAVDDVSHYDTTRNPSTYLRNYHCFGDHLQHRMLRVGDRLTGLPSRW